MRSRSLQTILSLSCALFACDSEPAPAPEPADMFAPDLGKHDDFGADAGADFDHSPADLVAITDMIQADASGEDLGHDLGAPAHESGWVSAPLGAREIVEALHDARDPLPARAIPARCDVSASSTRTVLDTHAAISSPDNILYTWGQDHYIGALDVDAGGFHEIIGSEFFSPLIAPLRRSEDGAYRYLTGDGQLITAGQVATPPEPLLEPAYLMQMLALHQERAAYLYHVETLALSRCVLGGACEVIGQMPEPLHREQFRPVFLGESLSWVGEESIWLLDLERGASTVLLENASVRAFTGREGAVSWLDSDGDLFLATEHDEVVYRIDRGVPILSEQEDAYHVLAIDSQTLYWFDGDDFRALDLATRRSIDVPFLDPVRSPLWLTPRECDVLVQHTHAERGAEIARIPRTE